MNKKVRVRFAPSPTGDLHIGGVRTALYNYLFAKLNNGDFILRIDDTDNARSSDQSTQQIINAFKWLNIKFTEGATIGGDYGPYYQSQRTDIYQKNLDILMNKDLAYPCFLTKDDIDLLKSKAKNEKKDPHFYLGKYRDLDKNKAKELMKSKPYSVRFKNPNVDVEFYDLVKGHVKFPKNMVGDFIIQRSDKSFVYDYTTVIDDALMKITHIIRGDDHVNNTSKQLMIYKAFNFDLPKFAHVSLLLNKDGKKLSKRDNSTSTDLYKRDGYLPQSLNNYLCLLGWSHPDDLTVFDVHKIKSFSIKRFNSSGAFFDISKLNHINLQYLKNLNNDDYKAWIKNHLKDSYNTCSINFSDNFNMFRKISNDRISNYYDLDNLINDLTNSSKIDLDNIELPIDNNTVKLMSSMIKDNLMIKSSSYLTSDNVSKLLDKLSKDLNLKGKDLFFPFRAILTGVTSGPDLKLLLPLIPINTLLKRID